MQRGARQFTLRRLLTVVAVVAMVFRLFGPMWPLPVIISGPIVGGWIGGAIGRRGKAWGLAGFGTAYAASLLGTYVYDSMYPSPPFAGFIGPELSMALGCGALVGWFGGLLAWAFTFDEIR